MQRGFWWATIIGFSWILSLGIHSHIWAQAAEEQVIVVPPEEDQKTKAQAPVPVPKGKVEALEKIVVTATKTVRNPDDVPASITVITKEDIKKQNIKTVDEALAQVPGTFDSRFKVLQDTMASVTLRGFPDQKRTLILLDGQNIASAYTNSVVWSSMPVENIERIEVIRGPFSALYGGNAMGGVINIITKTPKKLEAVAQTTYGSYNSWFYYLGASDRLWDKVSIQAGFNSRNSGGYATNLVTKMASRGAASPKVTGWIPTTTTTGSPTNIIGDSGDNFWNDYSINGKISWDIAAGHKVTFSTLASYSSYGYDKFHTYLTNTATGAPVVSGTVGLAGTNTKFTSLMEGAFLNGNGRTRSQVYNLTSEHKLTDTTNFKLHAGLVNQPENWYTTPGTGATTTFYGGLGTLSTTPSREWVAEMQVEQAIGQKQLWLGGLSYNTGWGSTQVFNLNNWRDPDNQGALSYTGGGRDRNVGIFLQDEISCHPMFSTVVGLRLDWWQTYGGFYMQSAGAPIVRLPTRSQTAVNPKIAFLFRPWEWMSWRASVGTAFRAPNIYELYTTWRAPSGTLYKSNPDLKPEKTVSWEIGATLKPFKGTVFTATYFENYVTDLIYRTTDRADPTGKTLLNENAGKATIRGVEIELSQKLWSWLEVFGNATLLDGRITDNPYVPASVGKKITFMPRQQFNFGVTVTYWKIKANLSGRYYSKLQSTDNNIDVVNNVYGSYDPAFTLNSKVIFSPVKYVDISLAVDNMLNRQYFYYYRAPGQTFWTQLTLKY